LQESRNQLSLKKFKANNFSKGDIRCITILTQKQQNQGDENIFFDIQPLADLPEIKNKLNWKVLKNRSTETIS
jgi:hypothetical protein